MICHVCHSDLLPDARFCHLCGAEARPPQELCPECDAVRSEQARVCHQCGHRYADPGKYLYGVFHLELRNAKQLEEQIKAHFFNFFENRLREEQTAKLYKQYLEVFFTSDFSRRFEARMSQLAEEVMALETQPQNEASQQADQLLQRAFNSLCDFFFVHYGKQLNVNKIPEAILDYDSANWEDTDLLLMMLDFLDFENEKESVYTNFMSMPMDKLKAAAKHFLFPARDEKILLICDLSVMGSGREGFAFTDRALYWKVHFQKPQVVFYDQLQSVKLEKKWLMINDKFFNATSSLNIKVMKLVRKIMEMRR